MWRSSGISSTLNLHLGHTGFFLEQLPFQQLQHARPEQWLHWAILTVSFLTPSLPSLKSGTGKFLQTVQIICSAYSLMYGSSLFRLTTISGLILIFSICLAMRSFWSPFRISSHMSSSAKIYRSGRGSGHSSEFTSSESGSSGSGGSITSWASASLWASSSLSSAS